MKCAYIRCNADHNTGYGHASRCISLALALQDLGFTCRFLLSSNDAQDSIERHMFPCEIVPSNDPGGDFLAKIVDAGRPDVLVLDVRPALSPRVVARLKSVCNMVAAIDDMSPGVMLADVLYLPPHPAVMRADFSNFSGVVRRGFSWVLLGNGLDLTKVPPPQRPIKNLLMCMGGSDPWGFTKRLAPATAKACAKYGINLGVVIGPGFQERKRLMEYLGALELTLFDAPQEMLSVYAWADAAISTVCVGAYELAAAGRPALYVCPDADYAEHAKAFENEGLGIRMPVPPRELGSFFHKLNLLAHSKSTIDSGGATRIARDIDSLT